VKPKKQKAKTSPATMPSTPEVGASSKSSPSTEHLKEKDVTEIDEEPETVGGTDQGANTDMPSIDEQKKKNLLKLRRLMMPSKEMKLHVVHPLRTLICFQL
jgi:hypothetical protein